MGHLPEKLKPDQAAVLQILRGNHKGKQFRLLSSQITLGRHSDCDIVFKDNPGCSRYHAKIKYKEGLYTIESLNPDNPVLINNKTISSHVFKSKDKISIGNIEMLFLDKVSAPYPVKASQGFSKKPKRKSKKKWLNPPRLILIAVLLGGAYLFTFEEEKKAEEKLNLKTESEILEEVEALKTLNEEEGQKKVLSPKEKAAKVAFLKGFRDYRKGYFHRALKMFQHCLVLHQQASLCQSYSNKSKTQIDKLIQKKIRLGKAYKENRQYEACKAAFKSVEIMVQDSGSLIYKEARENRRQCEIQLENKI